MKELGRLGLEISSVRTDNLELHTDDQKVKAKGEFLNQVSGSGTTNSTFTTTPANHQSHLESCQFINKTSLVEVNRTNDEEMKEAAENSNSTRSDCAVVTHSQSELSYNYPDLVGQKKQPQIQSEQKDGQLRPLCEESLKMSGIKVPGDFPMIDDDECEENSVGDKEKVSKVQSGDGLSAKPDLVEAVLVKTETVMVEAMPTPNHVNVSSPSLVNHQPQVRTLKSALKKTNVASNKKKGLRVSFHDTKVFYIDTEAEANAEPQLLTVHSLDLPLAPTDFRVFIPAYDFLPSVHMPTHPSSGYTAGVDRSYTYEDAIVSLRSYAQEVNNGGDDDDESEGEDEEFVAFNEANKSAELAASQSDQSQQSMKDQQKFQPQAEMIAPSENPIETVEEVKPISKDISTNNEEKVQDSDLDEGAVRCLTEANLREHEMILMEQDSFIEVIENSQGSEKEPELEEPILSSLPENVITNEKTLSPPLKELMVDISTLTSSNSVLNGPHSGTNSARDNWQVELSPLNSIPDSETESSTSSQDTIIMMTSEESERNENHIKQSQLNFDSVVKKEPVVGSVKLRSSIENSGASGSVGSQDSDETLKYDGNINPQLHTIRNIDMEGNLLQTKNSMYSASSSQSQRTSSQIRQLMERNAMRRNLMRYSNTKLKRSTPQINGDRGNETVNDVPPIEKQRQWRSHDSLLDTIKKLTLEEMRINEEGEAENGQDDGHDGHPIPITNGYKNHSLSQNHSNDKKHSVNGLTNGNLSIQDIQSLFNRSGSENSSNVNRFSNGTLENKSVSNLDAVPGDLRQWKIRSNQWQQVHHNGNNIGHGLNNQERHVSNGNYSRSSGSLDTLQLSTNNVDPSKPFLKNGVARCATLKEQYNNKDFYRVSLSHNYSQSDDHLELEDGQDDDLTDEANEMPDELSQFVQMDSGRTERLRKRYSYSDVDQYDNAIRATASNRRSSVRGIKPRFGSTSEILKQMQNQLQPPPLASHRHSSSHMTWPYPNGTNDPNLKTAIQEEVYGSIRFPPSRVAHQSPIYASATEIRAQMVRSSQQPISNNMMNIGRTAPAQVLKNNIYKQPPPYQPPPSPSQRNNGVSTTVPLKIHTKDERGVPEGASSSPKVLTDSVRHYPVAPSQSSTTVVPNGSNHFENNEGFFQKNSSQADSGVVYYVMQV